MKSHQEKFVTAVVLTLTIALFSTNFLKAEEQVQVEQDFDTVITTHVQSLWSLFEVRSQKSEVGKGKYLKSEVRSGEKGNGQ